MQTSEIGKCLQQEGRSKKSEIEKFGRRKGVDAG
jgi:hypothetical protein